MHTKSLSALLTGAILLSGCHSPAPATVAPTETPVTDSCAVLTPAEISAVIGVPIDPGQHTLASSDIMCSWSETAASGDAAQKVVLNFTSLVSFQKEEAASSRRIILTPASGIGDEAFYVTTEFGTSLYVRKGSTAISFGIHDKSLAANKLMAKERALGLKAATRL